MEKYRMLILMLILLYTFNPVVTSLRDLQQANKLRNVLKKFGCERASPGGAIGICRSV